MSASEALHPYVHPYIHKDPPKTPIDRLTLGRFPEVDLADARHPRCLRAQQARLVRHVHLCDGRLRLAPVGEAKAHLAGPCNKLSGSIDRSVAECPNVWVVVAYTQTSHVPWSKMSSASWRSPTPQPGAPASCSAHAKPTVAKGSGAVCVVCGAVDECIGLMMMTTSLAAWLGLAWRRHPSPHSCVRSTDRLPRPLSPHCLPACCLPG